MAENKEERPAYVRFEKRPLENRPASMAAGHYVGSDMELVLITPPGSKDEIEKLVVDWLAQNKTYVKDGRMSAELAAKYERAYEFWKKGEELPLDGTPIKGWPVLSPGQQKTCIEGANIRTVEDLSGANAEAMARLGMGGHEMKNKAIAWLKASASLGGVVTENAALKTQVATLEAQVASLTERNTALVAQLKEKATA